MSTRRIFITGSADGLGRLAAQTLLEEGHRVVVHVRDETRLAAVADVVARGAVAVVGDLGDLAQTRRVAEQGNALGLMDEAVRVRSRAVRSSLSGIVGPASENRPSPSSVWNRERVPGGSNGARNWPSRGGGRVRGVVRRGRGVRECRPMLEDVARVITAVVVGALVLLIGRDVWRRRKEARVLRRWERRSAELSGRPILRERGRKGE